MTTWQPRDGWPRLVAVEEAAHVPAARDLAVACARESGFTTAEVDAVALATTELAENQRRHAEHGQLVVAACTCDECGAHPDVLVTALDRGPGVARFERCLVDGYSTTGTLGTGLGAVARRAHRLDWYSEVGAGTVVVATFVTQQRPPRGRPRFDVGHTGFALTDDAPNGDAFAAHARDTRLVVMVADGLGHGAGAARASISATREFLAAADESDLARMLSGIDERVDGRGSAVSIASATVADLLTGGDVTTAGLGNVGVVALAPDGSTQRFVVDHGTVGGSSRRAGVHRSTPVPAGTVLVLHSDGLAASWPRTQPPALLCRDAATIAAVLWRDQARATDDTMVVVVKAVSWAPG